MNKLGEVYEFKEGLDNYLLENGAIFSYTQKLISQIVKDEDNYLKQQLIEYAKKYAKEKHENIKLILLNEEEVKRVIDLGINEYLRRNQ